MFWSLPNLSLQIPSLFPPPAPPLFPFNFLCSFSSSLSLLGVTSMHLGVGPSAGARVASQHHILEGNCLSLHPPPSPQPAVANSSWARGRGVGLACTRSHSPVILGKHCSAAIVHYLWLLGYILPFFRNDPQDLEGRRCKRDVPFRAKHAPVSYSLHTD